MGTAAGGGFPQWNCRCSLCAAARRGEIAPRLQASAAVSPDGEAWYLINATPDVTEQLLRSPQLHPKMGRRHTPLAGVLLTDSELDHTLGLLHLREGSSLAIYATEAVRGALDQGLRVLPALSCYTALQFSTVEPGRPVLLAPAASSESTHPGIEVDWFETGQDLPRYLGGRSAVGAVTGLELRDVGSGGRALFVPGAGEMTPALRERMRRADAIFLDGTFWSEDEFPSVSGSTRSAKDMGHLPISGAGGSAEELARMPAKLKRYIHINNTNPVLDPRSKEREHIRSLGLDLAADGEEVEL